MLLAACTDPRARPVAPLVQVQFAPSFKLTSPGAIVASLYMFDDDGLKSLRLTLTSPDTLLRGDSILFLTGDNQLTRPINWQAPAGIATGTAATLTVRVEDFAGFASTTSVNLTVQDSTAAVR